MLRVRRLLIEVCLSSKFYRPASTCGRNPGVAVLRDFHHNCADTSNLKAFLVSGCLESVVMVPGCRQALM